MLLAAGVVVALMAFRQLITLSLAVVMTVILAIPLAALATRLQRWRIPRTIGASAGLLAALLVAIAVAALIVPPLVEETERFVDAVPGIVDSARGQIRDLTGAEPGAVGERVKEYLEGLLSEPSRVLGPLLAVGFGIVGVIGAAVLVVITAFYMAVRPEPLVEGALRLFPPRHREHVLGAMLEIRAAWLGWLLGVLVDMAVTGVLLYLGLWLVGLDFRLVFAVFAAVLVVVPYFGAIVGAIPPVLFALTISPGKALAVLVVYLVVQQIEGNVVIPVVMSRAVRLHPAVIAVGVVVVGTLFGLVGLMISVPLISATVILVRRLWVEQVERTTSPDHPKAVGEMHDTGVTARAASGG